MGVRMGASSSGFCLFLICVTGVVECDGVNFVWCRASVSVAV